MGHARKAEGASSLAAVAEPALALAVTAGQLGEADQEAEVAGGPALALAAAVGQLGEADQDAEVAGWHALDYYAKGRLPKLALALAVTAGQLGEADQEAEVAGGPALALAAAVGQPLWGMLLQELLLGPWRGSAGQHGWPLALCQKPSRKPRGLRQELRLRPFSYLDARVASAGGTLL